MRKSTITRNAFGMESLHCAAMGRWHGDVVDGLKPPLLRSDSLHRRASMYNKRDPVMREWKHGRINRTPCKT